MSSTRLIKLCGQVFKGQPLQILKASLLLLAAALLIFPASLAAAAGAGNPPAPAARPPILRIAHVAFLTSNLTEARRFYGTVLGFDEAFDVKLPGSGANVAFFKVNDHQYIELYSLSGGPNEDHLVNIAFETPDVKAMHAYLASRGVRDLESVHPLLAKNPGFALTDPNGHVIQFVQYTPGSMTGQRMGKDLPASRVSTEIIHAGFIVRNRATDDQLYKDILGFSLMWYGGKNDTETDWLDMRVPNGSNWIEYMMNVHDLSQHTLGVNHHFSLGVPSVAAAAKIISARGYKPVKPQIGRDGKWQLNLYDPDGTRVEMMEPKPVRTPCCSPMHLQ
ncbi:MAG TPA: VOC family protein [Terriglobia bacterium]|nr:VOC family protein [Terriglobia bacterium]